MAGSMYQSIPKVMQCSGIPLVCDLWWFSGGKTSAILLMFCQVGDRLTRLY